MSAKKILVVDDDQDLLDVYTQILQSTEHIVYTANNSEEAVNLFSQNNPDVVVLDMIMEKVDSGIQVCKTIRETDTTVKIYLVSNVGDPSIENIDIQGIGFNGALQKPLKPIELLNLVSE
jgi:CheY-like chemotaxis protein